MQVGFPCNFAEYDTNKDGEIDKAEFETVLNVSDSAAALEVFNTWDKNGDGVIDCAEFLTIGKSEFQCEPKGCGRPAEDEADEELWASK